MGNVHKGTFIENPKGNFSYFYLDTEFNLLKCFGFRLRMAVFKIKRRRKTSRNYNFNSLCSFKDFVIGYLSVSLIFNGLPSEDVLFDTTQILIFSFIFHSLMHVLLGP